MEPKHIHLIDTLIDRQTTKHKKGSVSLAGFSRSLRNPLLYLFCHVDIVSSKHSLRLQSLFHQTNRPFLSKTTQGLVKTNKLATLIIAVNTLIFNAQSYKTQNKLCPDACIHVSRVFEEWCGYFWDGVADSLYIWLFSEKQISGFSIDLQGSDHHQIKLLTEAQVQQVAVH